MRRILSFAVLVFAVLAGSIAATQYLARAFAYAPELGKPLMSVGGVALYLPFDWYRWEWQWGRHAKKDFAVALGLACGGVLLGLGAGLRLRSGDRTPQPTGAHGTAEWAELGDLEQVGIVNAEGIVLCQTAEAELRRTADGRWEQRKAGRLLRHDGPEHAPSCACC